MCLSYCTIVRQFSIQVGRVMVPYHKFLISVNQFCRTDAACAMPIAQVHTAGQDSTKA